MLFVWNVVVAVANVEKLVTENSRTKNMEKIGMRPSNGAVFPLMVKERIIVVVLDL